MPVLRTWKHPGGFLQQEYTIAVTLANAILSNGSFLGSTITAYSVIEISKQNELVRPSLQMSGGHQDLHKTCL